jgi:hypothetical protein
MKANFLSRPIARERVFIPVAEFTFAAYPVHIASGCRSLFDATIPPIRPSNGRPCGVRKILI